MRGKRREQVSAQVTVPIDRTTRVFPEEMAQREDRSIAACVRKLIAAARSNEGAEAVR